MFPAVMLSAAVILTPQPVLIPSDMLRYDHDNIIWRSEQLLERAKKAGVSEEVIEQLKKQVEREREKKEQFDKRNEPPKDGLKREKGD